MSHDSGSPDGMVGPQPRAARAGWGFLAIATLSRAYLVLMLSLGACATLPMLTGLTGSIVQSGSMEPLISAGDVVLSEPMEEDTPPPLGLVVSFPAPAGSATEGIVLHRVVGANEDGSLITAGDANESTDSTALDRTDIISQARLLIPWIGLPAFWLNTAATTPLLVWFIVSVTAVVIVAFDGTAVTRRIRTPRPPRTPGRVTGRRVKTAELIALGVVGCLIAVTLVAAPPTTASAAFSATTTMAGNAWETAGPATQLAFTTSPIGSTGGTALEVQPVVTIQNAAGEVSSSTANVLLTLTNAAGASLVCSANPVAAIAGRATFGSCRIDRAGTYTLTARSGALPATVSSTFTIRTGPAVKLAFTAQPGAAPVDSSFAAQPVVAIHDAGGNIVSTTAAVTLALTTGLGASLACTNNPRSAVAGNASFAGCKVNKPGSYTLTATAAGLTSAVSISFLITSGPAARLVFTTNPNGATGGSAFSTQPVVAVRDAGNNPVAAATPVTLTITTPDAAILTCAANPATSASGTVSFTGCSIDRAGSYTLTASSGTLATAVSVSFTVAVGPAAKLGFTSAPSTTRYNTSFDTQPRVAVQDAGGNTVATTAAVTLRLTTAAGATLYCTTNPKTSVSGVAAFSGCRIDKAGSYTFTATSGSLAPAVSNVYTVTAGPAAKLAFSVNPGGATGGVAFSSQPTVLVQDAGGNTAASAAGVTLSLTNANGATLSCAANPVTAQSGMASFTGCAVNRSGSYTLRAVSGSLSAATSSTFTVTAGPAARLVFASSPGTTTSGATFATTPTVTVQDAGGNAVAATGQATLALTNAAGALLRCTANPVPATFGVRFSFTGCNIDKAGQYTLTASSGTLVAAVSSAFTISPGAANKMVFVGSPSGGVVNQVWGTQPTVVIQDVNGNTVVSSAVVTLRLTNPAGATLTCSANPRAASSGVATFAGCRTNRAATYTLTATSGTLVAAVSPGFTVVP